MKISKETEEKLNRIIEQKLNDIFIMGSSFDEIDCLSSHTRPTEVCIEKIHILSTDKNYINFAGDATVACDLQWGSDGDVKRGDGGEMHMTFPFSFKGRASVQDPLKIEIAHEDIKIDTSSYSR